ncbi:MAG: metallopeptidase family protein [Planctomycetota bacterium]
MNPEDRARFDTLVERVIEALPATVAVLLEEVPVMVEDLPDAATLEELGMESEQADELCGLHTGVMRTERSIDDHAVPPSDVVLYREGIVRTAGGWEAGDRVIEDEIRITLLHELGHEMGLEEDDLDDLGYG